MATKQTKQHVQRDFSGGEISGKLLMRTDTEVYRRSVLEMVNFIPTLQGGAQRAPGTRFIQEIEGTTEARILPYLTTGNERSLVLLTPEGLKLIRNVTDPLSREFANTGSGASITYRKRVLQNGDFRNGSDGWQLQPNKYDSRDGDGPLGAFWIGADGEGAIKLSPRLYKYPATDSDTVFVKRSCEVDVATDRGTIQYRIDYLNNPPQNVGAYTLTVVVSPNSDMSSPVYSETYTDAEYRVGSVIEAEENFDMPTAAWTGTLYVKVTAVAKSSAEREYSNPQFNLHSINVLAAGETVLADADLTTPYLEEDLADLHFVQSPYGDKELVITHPKHEPRKLYFDTGGAAYSFEAITFSNAPSIWSENNYPATCTAYHGRLVLAGSQSFRVPTGDPVSAAAETVWGTKVGEWGEFSTATGVNPDDSIEFTAIYRSPIQWVFGHKTLLIGAQEYEYIASGDGIFSPGDLGVNLHSTSGSANVQPAAFGEAVLFASDAGTKVRSMRYSADDDGWVAPDMTLLNPGICFPGIRRMVRLRNPHQMCLVVTKRGEVSIFHSEQGVQGWSRYRLDGGFVIDVAVVGDNDGFDVPFFLVRRNIDGTEKLYLEAIPNWNDGAAWDYTASTVEYNFTTPTDTLTGLDHLEGKIVQVWSPARFLSFYKVVGGEITLTDDTGGTTNVTSAKVGLGHPCMLKLLPPETVDPGASKRYADFSVRTLYSTRPIINGERPKDRTPVSQTNLSEPLDVLNDLQIATKGWNPYQIITIEERVPMRCEVIGVYGKLAANSA